MTLPVPGSPLDWRQLLAAYADGELDATTRRRVRAWLAAHPEARANLDDQRAFSPRNQPYWNSVRLDRPADPVWDRIWGRIDAQLDAPYPTPPPRSHRRWWKRGLILIVLTLPSTVAAAAAVTLCFPGHSPPAVVAPIDDPSLEEVFEVAKADDVEILSVRDADASSLVVGEPPLARELTLVVAGDVRLDGVLPAGDGMVPAVQMGGWTDAPMIFVPSLRTP